MSFKYMDPDQRQCLFTQAENDNKEGKAPPMDMGVMGFDSKTIKDLLLT